MSSSTICHNREWIIVGALCCVINGHTTTTYHWSHLSLWVFMHMCVFVWVCGFVLYEGSMVTCTVETSSFVIHFNDRADLEPTLWWWWGTGHERWLRAWILIPLMQLLMRNNHYKNKAINFSIFPITFDCMCQCRETALGGAATLSSRGDEPTRVLQPALLVQKLMM